jgi:Ca2+-transporting ATPase
VVDQDVSRSRTIAEVRTGTDTGQGRPWFALSPERALVDLNSDASGLSAEDATARFQETGPNSLPRVGGTRPFAVLWAQINEPLIWVLIGAAALALALGKVNDGLIVAAVVVINAVIGFLQEFRASKAVEALSDMVPEYATVMRDGALQRVPVATLVPGDVVHLGAGDEVPADLRLLTAKGLQVEEAMLTGESVPAVKSSQAVAADARLGDRTSMVFGGTLVTSGTATALVVETGSRTELGRMSSLLQQVVELETPLTKALGRLGRTIALAVVALAATMLVIGSARAVAAGADLADAFADSAIFAISLAVGAIPEGLPAIVTVALAVGVRRMANRRAIVRSLPAVETLGSTSVVCTDKTGTLTRNEMVVRAVRVGQREFAVGGVGYEPSGTFELAGESVAAPAEVQEMLRDAALCSDATLVRDGDVWTITGDPTEGAIMAAAYKAGIDAAAARRKVDRVDAVPFDSDLQMMAVLVDDDLRRRLIVKGAPEAVVSRAEMSEAERDGQLRRVGDMASRGLRVLAIASRPWTHDRSELLHDDLVGLRFDGLVGMMDPPRAEAIDAVRACHDGGIGVKMITGDHAITAAAIGREIGLDAGERAVTGSELATMDEDELDRTLAATDVFARVAPEQKLRLVRALQRMGQVVAMTGDGTNDAPALKQADVGVAMGITGTSVSKEAADLVLTDDNFASIRAAIEEGRRVYDNLIKSLVFVLPTNLALALILMFAVAFFPFDEVTGELLLPIQPSQILWINLVASVALAVPLAFEVAEANVMRRRPRDPQAPPLSRFVVLRTISVAVLIAAGAIGLSIWEYRTQLADGLTHAVAIADAQTMAVTTVIFSQVFYVLLSRSLTGSSMRRLSSNPAIVIGIVGILLLQAAFVYLPVMHSIFETAPLTPLQLAVSMAGAAMLMSVIAIQKAIACRRQPVPV